MEGLTYPGPNFCYYMGPQKHMYFGFKFDVDKQSITVSILIHTRNRVLNDVSMRLKPFPMYNAVFYICTIRSFQQRKCWRMI